LSNFKTTRKDSCGSGGFIPQEYDIFRNIDIGRDVLGFDYEGFYKQMQDPYHRAQYLKMKAAMDEGYMYVYWFFGIGLAPVTLPELIAWGGTDMLAVKTTASVVSQLAVNHDVDAVDVAADAFLIPGVSGVVGGFADFNLIEGRQLQINTNPNRILFNGATSLLSDGMGNRFAPAINQLPTRATRVGATIMITTPYSTVEQGLNYRYEEKK
jgi:hypothetical protein